MALTVDFYLDPVCPWTWMTSRWLADVAQRRELTIRWWPLSLALINEGQPLPPEFDTPELRVKIAIADAALRVLAVLAAEGEHERAGRFYAEFGRRHHDGGDPEADPVAAAAGAVGAADALTRAADSAVDATIAATLREALDIAGPDVGSPVLRIGDAQRGFFGPIQSPRLTGSAADQLFDAVSALQSLGPFLELKRGRHAEPAVGPDHG